MNRDVIQLARVGALRIVDDFQPLRLPPDVERIAARRVLSARLRAVGGLSFVVWLASSALVVGC